MNEFKIGDRVRRTKDSWGGMKVGDEGVITVVDGPSVEIQGFYKRHAYYNLELVVVPTPLTPKELADEFRQCRTRIIEIGQELEKLGFQMYFSLPGKKEFYPVVIPDQRDIEFRKTVKTEEVV